MRHPWAVRAPWMAVMAAANVGSVGTRFRGSPKVGARPSYNRRGERFSTLMRMPESGKLVAASDACW